MNIINVMQICRSADLHNGYDMQICRSISVEVNTGSGQTRQNLQIHFRKLRTADLQQAEAGVAERWGTEALLYSCRKNFTNQAAKTDHTHM